MDQMREAVADIEDKKVKAYTLTQLILKYGTRGWVDQLIDQAGPVLLRNTNQIAAILERMQRLVSSVNNESTF